MLPFLWVNEPKWSGTAAVQIETNMRNNPKLFWTVFIAAWVAGLFIVLYEYQEDWKRNQGPMLQFRVADCYLCIFQEAARLDWIGGLLTVAIVVYHTTAALALALTSEWISVQISRFSPVPFSEVHSSIPPDNSAPPPESPPEYASQQAT